MAQEPQPQDPEWLNEMYNNRARVPGHVDHFADWDRRSADVRERDDCRLDLPYGDGFRESLDVFRTRSPKAPVLVFIHGGYWRALSKSDHSFLARPFTRAGACVVMPNYALCPGTATEPVGVPHITLQMVRALAWTWRHIAAHGGDPGRITVVGHSAGGHLAAILLTCLWNTYARDLPPQLVKNALSISGLYDLETLRRTPYLQDALQLTPEQASDGSPALLPAPRGRKLYAVTGGNESAEYLRQNQLIQDAWGEDVVPVCEVLPRLDHFSVLDTLAQPGSRTNTLALELLGLPAGSPNA